MSSEKHTITNCFVCGGKTFEIHDGEFGCDTCKRVWIRGDGQWESLPRTVRLKKTPQPGDTVDDLIEPFTD